ncbi:helix-turn-helix domain-containing protein [Neisseria lactamica]|uniref:helix-turn-helix domain-containing protein n=1 Tax=Neisseria lactamica TaxID=486 RepID=UPI001EFE25E9|nr:helix-turn-helix domain-containing protein [Neisseria lactamica]
MNALVSQFNPSQIAIIDHNGGKWLTAEQLGLALGFSPNNANDGVGRLYRRHIDEFSEKDTTTVKLTAVDGKIRDHRIFSHSGCNLLSFFANTPNAKAFRAWAKEKLAEPAADMLQVDRDTLQYAFDRAERLEEAYLAVCPDMARLLRYLEIGLNQAEAAKLLGIAPSNVRRRLKQLADLGLADYRPDPKYRNRHALAAANGQQSLGLEG